MTDPGTQLLETLYKRLELEYADNRQEIHVSDITLCPRETCFRRLNPQPLSKTDLSFFTSGEAIGAAIQALAVQQPNSDDLAPRYVAEHEVKLGDLVAHVDLYDTLNNIPIECKSFNGSDMDQPKSHYTAQLKAYMAMLNAPVGIILVQLLQHFRSKKGSQPFKTWVITMTKEELITERLRLGIEARILADAIEMKEPALARPVVNDPQLNWKCGYCKFIRSCQDIEAKKK